jgi:alpha-L-arabinofuranosidase
VQFTQVWNTRWINQNTSGIAWPNYPESEYDILKTDNSMTPQGLALNLIGNYTLSEMVSATPQTGKVFAFASFDPVTNKLNVFLVNKNTTATATTVTLQNYISPSTGLVNRLGGTDSTDTSPTLISKPSVSITGNQFSITLDPVSVTVVQIG